MTYPTKAWLIMCLVILYSCGMWFSGAHTTDKKWRAKEVERQRSDAKAANALSEEYRAKEQKLNETIGEIETRAINDAANAEMEYKDVMDRLRNASANADNGLRVKPALACRAVPRSAAAASDGNEEVQAGLPIEAAWRIIGVGAECDQVVISLDACQAYVESLQK